MILKRTIRVLFLAGGSISLLLLMMISSPNVQASDNAFGDGTFNSCTFSQCSITLTTSGTVNINITPGASTTCTVQSDAVGVLTDSSTGYNLTLNDSDTNNNIVGTTTATPIPAINALRTTSAALTANTWGYRIDDSGGALGTTFGTGTTAQTNVAIGSLSINKFAKVPTSGSDQIATRSSAANPVVTTSVWYGICANLAVPADSYTDQVTYTALIN